MSFSRQRTFLFSIYKAKLAQQKMTEKGGEKKSRKFRSKKMGARKKVSLPTLEYYFLWSYDEPTDNCREAKMSN